ncbi:MAG: DUF4886 domain-containing protein [Clostridia bacterium]|nr:DUF4886 domain-containing protein [Clostridia bacterium]
MKKVISIILTFAMILSMNVSIFAQTDADKSITDGVLTGEFGVSNGLIVEKVAGFMGKNADNSVLKMTNPGGDAYLNGGGIVSVGKNNEVLHKYYVLKFNYMPINDSGLAFRTENNGNVITPVAYTNFKQNEWNSVLIYVDYSAIEEGYDYTQLLENSKNKTTPLIPDSEISKVCPIGHVFVNGKEIGTGLRPTRLQDRFGMWNTYYHPSTGKLITPTMGNNAFRLGFGSNNEGKSGYIDDLYVYSTDDAVDGAAMTTLPSLANGNSFTVKDGVIEISADTTVADLKAAVGVASIVSAYSDSACKNMLADSDKLFTGDKVILENDSRYSLYTVLETGIAKSITDGKLSDGFTGANGLTVAQVAGSAGKATDDLVLSVANNTEGKDAYLAGGGLESVDKNNNVLHNYYVLKFNYKPTNYTGLSFRSANNGNVIAPVAYTNFNQDKWNSVLIYVDYTGIDADYDYTTLLENSKNKTNPLIPESEKAKVCPVGHIFINGTEIGTGNMPTRIQDRFGMWNTYYHPSTGALVEMATAETTFRLGFGSTAAGKAAEIDDLYIYQTDTKPALADTIFTLPEASSALSISEGVANVAMGNSVATLSSLYPKYKFIAYKEAEMINVIDETTPLIDGMMLAISDRKGVVAYYTVSEHDNSTVLYQAKNYADFGTFTGGAKSEISGLAGKVPADTSAYIKADGQSTYFDYSWGTKGASWDKLDYKGYLVNEFSILNSGATKILVATDENSAISAELQEKLTDNLWNRVVVITDRTGGENNGKTKTFVNGIAISDWLDDNLGKAVSGSYNNTIRYYFEAPQGSGIYLDDVKIYEIEAAPGVQPLIILGETFSAAGSNFNIIKDTKLSDVAYAGYTISGYSDATFTTALTADAVIEPGNVIVAEYKNGAITYFTARNWTGITDVLTAIPESVAGGSSEKTTAPVAGKTADDLNYKISGQPAYYEIDWTDSDPLSKYLVYEVNVAPKASSSVLFATNDNVKMSPALSTNDGLLTDKWNKVINVYNIDLGYSDTYINGVKVSEEFKTAYKASVRDVIRFNITGEAYVDDMKIYESAIYPEIKKPFEIEDGFNSLGYIADNAAKTVTINVNTEAGKVASYFDEAAVSIFADEAMTTPLAATEKLANGGMLVAVTDDLSYSYYKICDYKYNDIIVLGDIYDAAANTLKGIGTATFVAPVTEGGILYAAQYDSTGKLAKIEIDNETANGCLAIDFKPEDLIDSKVKVFLMDSAAKMKPLCENVELDRKVAASILVLGNSFSKDGVWYLRDIAAADGAEYNVGILDLGGKGVNEHYDLVETPSAIMLIYNGKGVKYTNLSEALAEYDWDYVAIQNWGYNRSYYYNTDECWDANWSKIVPLAEYIHEKEPKAEIMLHETWAFETGYRLSTDEAGRDAATEDIRALHDRAARECAEAIGQSTPLRKLSALEAFEAARDYKNEDGVDIFNTVYYPEGHIFVGVGNRATVPVGDGSCLVSPEELALGKINLHRDGYHASAAARYMLSLNAYQTLSGRKVLGNTAQTVELSLDSSASYASDNADMNDPSNGVLYLKFDPLKPELMTTLQTIIDGMKR